MLSWFIQGFSPSNFVSNERWKRFDGSMRGFTLDNAGNDEGSSLHAGLHVPA